MIDFGQFFKSDKRPWAQSDPMDVFSIPDFVTVEETPAKSFIYGEEALGFLSKNIPLSADGPWIAGGACLDWFLNRRVRNDIDIYFKDKQQFLQMKYNCDKNGQMLVETENAYTYTMTTPDGENDCHTYQFQLICKKWHESAQAVVDDFDISVCQIAWDGSQIYYGKTFIEDVNKRQFRFSQINEMSHRRLIKYIIYGFEPVPESYQQLFSSDIVDWKKVGTDSY